MHICFFRFGSSRRQQALQGGGGVTVVVSRGHGGVLAKVVVSRGELERIAAGVTRRLRGAAAPRQPQRLPAPPPVALERQMTRTPRSEPAEEGTGVTVRRGEWRPALDGIPEEAQ